MRRARQLGESPETIPMEYYRVRCVGRCRVSILFIDRMELNVSAHYVHCNDRNDLRFIRIRFHRSGELNAFVPCRGLQKPTTTTTSSKNGLHYKAPPRSAGRSAREKKEHRLETALNGADSLRWIDVVPGELDQSHGAKSNRDSSIKLQLL